MLKWSTQKSVVFEAEMIKLCANPLNGNTNNKASVEERVGKIEDYLKSGNFVKQVGQKISIQQTDMQNTKEKI